VPVRARVAVFPRRVFCPKMTRALTDTAENNTGVTALFHMVWLVTISCYGSRLPGDQRGSYDHVRQGERRAIPPAPALERYGRKLMRAEPFLLTQSLHRQTVLKAIQEVCLFREWALIALHVRNSHLHGIVESGEPWIVVQDWKSYSTRALRRLPGEPRNQLYWTRGGSTNPLRSASAIQAAVHYVLAQQGEPLEHYCAKTRDG
jgi:hypothetical protein